MTLEPGAERTEEFVAEGRLLTDVGGTLPVSVLSTPGMIAVMERCAAVLAFEQLGEGRATVGFEVCVKHVGAAGEGAAVKETVAMTHSAAAHRKDLDMISRSARGNATAALGGVSPGGAGDDSTTSTAFGIRSSTGTCAVREDSRNAPSS